MILKGTIHVMGETQKITEKFSKREVVIKVEDGKYPQMIACQLTQDKCGLGDFFKYGDNVEASINLRGREWTNPKTNQTQYFNTLEIWRLQSPDADLNKPIQAGAPDVTEDDLPF